MWICLGNAKEMQKNLRSHQKLEYSRIPHLLTPQLFLIKEWLLYVLVCEESYNQKYHRLGGFDNKHLLLTVLGAEKSRSHLWHILYLVRTCFLGLQMASFSLYPHVTESRERPCVSSFHKGSTPIVRASLMTSSNQKYLLKAPPSTTIPLGLGFQQMNWGEAQTCSLWHWV